MKSTTKKILALVLCVAICFSSVAVAYGYTSRNAGETSEVQTESGVSAGKVSSAVTDDVENCYDTVEEATDALIKAENKSDAETKVNPLIVIPGIGMSRCSVFNEDGTRATMEDGSLYPTWTVFSLVTDDITKLIWPAVKSIVCQKDKGLSTALQEVIPSMFRYSVRGTDGKMLYNVKALTFDYPVSQYSEDDKGFLYRMLPFQEYTAKAGEENTYVFNYTAFSNTLEEADNLNDYIQMVKEQTGAEKVNLLPVSLGGTVASAYFDKYAANDDVYKVVSVVAAWDGSDVFADLLTENYAENSKELLYNEVLPEILGETTGNLVNIALRLFPNSVLREILDAAMAQLRESVIINTTSLWALVPSDRYDAIANELLSDGKYDYIRAQTDQYHKAQANLQNRMYELNEKYGVKFYNICGYNLEFGEGWTDYQYFKFFDSASKTNSDGIIQISSTGIGTSFVKAGTAFKDDYAAKNPVCTDKSHNHISPDGSIDASTAYWPENVWYFNEQHHEIAYNNIVHKLVSEILLTENIQTVHDEADIFPQFNDSRMVKKLVRDYLPAAEAIDRSTLSETDAKELDAAVADCNAMLGRTIADREADDAVIQALFDKLVELGVYEVKKDSFFTKTSVFVLNFVSDVLYKALGPKGFSEICKK